MTRHRAAILPLALIDGIPFGRQLIDCSFAVGGTVPLTTVRRRLIAPENSKNFVARASRP